MRKKKPIKSFKLVWERTHRYTSTIPGRTLAEARKLAKKSMPKNYTGRSTMGAREKVTHKVVKVSSRRKR